MAEFWDVCWFGTEEVAAGLTVYGRFGTLSAFWFPGSQCLYVRRRSEVWVGIVAEPLGYVGKLGSWCLWGLGCRGPEKAFGFGLWDWNGQDVSLKFVDSSVFRCSYRQNSTRFSL